MDSDSVTSTPRSTQDDAPPRVRFMCSFNGKILPRPHDNQLRYVGGDTRIVAVNRHVTFSSLLSKLSKLSGTTNTITIKYQLPSEDLDALITVAADEDVENMMEEYDRLLSSTQKSARLRVFLFSNDDDSINDNNKHESRSSSINSLLDGSAKRESWFVDALNGGQGSGRVLLDRGRSEVSSIVSEVPDYLFGLDTNSEDNNNINNNKTIIKNNNNNNKNDVVLNSDSGSPFGSTSSSLAPPSIHVIPNLPPVKTRPVMNQVQVVVEEKMVNTQQGVGYSGSPMWQHYPNQGVYYVPNSPMRAQFVQPYPVGPGQMPIGFPGQVYGTGMRQYEMPVRMMSDNNANNNQGMYYGARVVPGSYPGMVVPGAEEMQVSGADVVSGRVSQGS